MFRLLSQVHWSVIVLCGAACVLACSFLDAKAKDDKECTLIYVRTVEGRYVPMLGFGPSRLQSLYSYDETLRMKGVTATVRKLDDGTNVWVLDIDAKKLRDLLDAERENAK